MNDQNHICDLLPAFALGCLDDDEAGAVAEHLAACDKCQLRLAEFRQSVNLLAYGAPDSAPPASLKRKLMSRIAATSDAPGMSAHRFPRWRRAFRKPRFSPVWAVTALIVITALAAVNMMQWQLNRPSFQTEAAAELMIIKMKGTARAPEGDGTIVISQDRKQGVLVASDLPVLDEDHQYQLWMVRNGQRISGGVFSVMPNGYATVKIYAKELLTNFRSFEVTVEPAGGSLTPGRHLVMVSRI